MRSSSKNTKARERKGIYILPNLFTSASLFGGFYAIIATIQDRYEAAALAIVLSAILDGLDGRIARFTHTTSHFGREYDSLADLIAFGAAPGVLAFRWALESFGRLGWLAAFLYVACGALRLARFNVQKSGMAPNCFKGLPIPAAACFISSAILFTTATGGGILENRPVALIITIILLSFLMVSTVRYLSLKQMDIRHQRPFDVLVSMILICVVIAYKPKIMLFFIMLTYVLSGPVVTLYRLYRKRTIPADIGPAPLPLMDNKGGEAPSDILEVEHANGT
ncbi:MAG: CDP-diacylglycerol--serine O-phosphatidyltransferase [Deltaproteobacteria bacterium]|nr:CDP-diacylglycerol--serine O-phosphatidyltransferase [Deltaproteobacteria bacterium]